MKENQIRVLKVEPHEHTKECIKSFLKDVVEKGVKEKRTRSVTGCRISEATEGYQTQNEVLYLKRCILH